MDVGFGWFEANGFGRLFFVPLFCYCGEFAEGKDALVLRI